MNAQSTSRHCQEGLPSYWKHPCPHSMGGMHAELPAVLLRTCSLFLRCLSAPLCSCSSSDCSMGTSSGAASLSMSRSWLMASRLSSAQCTENCTARWAGGQREAMSGQAPR